MSTGQSLLAAILDQPACDTARLVYADWLDEQPTERVPCPKCAASGLILLNPGPDGQWLPCPVCGGAEFVPDTSNRESAEFIRVQVELAQLNYYCNAHRGHQWRAADWRCGKSDVCEVCRLRDREQFLWNTGIGRRMDIGRCQSRLPWESGIDVEPHICIVRRGLVDAITCTTDAWLQHGPTILAVRPVTWITLPEVHIEIVAPMGRSAWHLLYRANGQPQPFAGSWELPTRADMVERLMQDIRDLQSEFA